MLSFKSTLSLISLLQFISFSGLLLCCLTSPIIKTWGLARLSGVSYGAFGYCRASDVVSCSSAHFMYNPSKITLPGSSFEHWWLNHETRNTVGKLLISIPIATGLTFICFLLSLLSSLTYHPGVTNVTLIFFNVILQTMTLLSTLLAFVTILALFHPYTTWCGWLSLPCLLCSLTVCVLLVLGWISLRSQTETADKEASTENVESILKLYGRSQTNSAHSDKSLQITKSTAASSSSRSVYVSTNISSDVQKTLDPNQDKLSIITNQDEPLSENCPSLQQGPLVNFFIPKMNDAGMFAGKNTGKWEALSLDKIDLTSLHAKQEEIEMPTTKNTENILYYEETSNHSQRRYDPPWLFGTQFAKTANDFEVYSQRDYEEIAPPQYQLPQLINYQHQGDAHHNSSFPCYSQQTSIGYSNGNDHNPHPVWGISKHSHQTLPQTYDTQHMQPRKYTPAYKQRIQHTKSNPQPAYSFY